MQEWKIIDTRYLDYLRNGYDTRIPRTNYGAGKFKPFFGELFRVDGLVYLTQVSSPKPRHQNMKNSMDFIKLFHTDGRLIAVVNLNYMFPAPVEVISKLEYRNIDQYVTFSTLRNRSNYIDLLQKEMVAIQQVNIEKKAENLRTLKIEYPENKVSRRCVDFLMLEKAAREWIQNNT